jgi:hypothetical protein
MSFELRWMGAVGVGVGESRLEGGPKPKVEGEALVWVTCGPRRWAVLSIAGSISTPSFSNNA